MSTTRTATLCLCLCKIQLHRYTAIQRHSQLLSSRKKSDVQKWGKKTNPPAFGEQKTQSWGAADARPLDLGGNSHPQPQSWDLPHIRASSEFDSAPSMGFSTALLHCVINTLHCSHESVKHLRLCQTWTNNSSMSCSWKPVFFALDSYMKNEDFWYASLAIHTILVKTKISFSRFKKNNQTPQIQSSTS